jgi:hypothetical protein
MGVHVIAVYRPKEGMQSDLEAEIVDHVPLLRRLGLATDFPSIALRASDGTVIEHFEWVDQDAMAAAHEHPEVLAMWGRYEACCVYGTLADLSNATSMFPEFELLGSF